MLFNSSDLKLLLARFLQDKKISKAKLDYLLSTLALLSISDYAIAKKHQEELGQSPEKHFFIDIVRMLKDADVDFKYNSNVEVRLLDAKGSQIIDVTNGILKLVTSNPESQVEFVLENIKSGNSVIFKFSHNDLLNSSFVEIDTGQRQIPQIEKFSKFFEGIIDNHKQREEKAIEASDGQLYRLVKELMPDNILNDIANLIDQHKSDDVKETIDYVDENIKVELPKEVSRFYKEVVSQNTSEKGSADGLDQTSPIVYIGLGLAGLALGGGGGGSSEPTNNAPTLTTLIPDSSIEQGSVFGYDATVNFDDIDVSDNLTYSINVVDNYGATQSWLTIDPSSGVLSGAPQSNSTSVNVTVTATDGSGEAVSDTFVLQLLSTVWRMTDHLSKHWCSLILTMMTY